MSRQLTGNIIANPEDKSFRSMVIVILTIVLAFTLSSVVFELGGSTLNKIILLIAAGITLACLIFAIRGNPRPGQILTPIIMFIALIMINVFGGGNGIFDSGIIGLVSIITLASLLQGNRGTVAYIILVTITLFAMGMLDIAGLYVPTRPTSVVIGDIGVVVTITLANGLLLFVLIRRLTEAAQKAIENEELQIKANRELIGLKENLELRIKERTSALEEANTINVRRASQFESIAEVARATASLQDLETLLSNITQLISQRFGFYHVGIFLVDDSHEHAILSSANSEGGKRMLQRGHKLKVGEIGIVGNVTATGNPRIALDIGKDATFFNNPDLPETRSEMTLPLKTGNTIIGALDVQSKESNAFTKDDITVLSTLADQVATAIQDARLFQESQVALLESNLLFGDHIRKAWDAASRPDLQIGYRFTGSASVPLDFPVNTPEMLIALEKGETSSHISEGENSKSALAIPLKIGNQVIAALNVTFPTNKSLSTDEIEILEAVINRTSLALENATLLEETQRRASKERIISKISTTIGSVTNIDSIIETAVRELGNTMPGAEIAIQFSMDNE